MKRLTRKKTWWTGTWAREAILDVSAGVLENLKTSEIGQQFRNARLQFAAGAKQVVNNRLLLGKLVHQALDSFVQLNYDGLLFRDREALGKTARARDSTDVFKSK